MKKSKKILNIFLAIMMLLGISTGIAWGMTAFSFSFWKIFWLITIIQYAGPLLYKEFVELKYIKKALAEYNSKPFKQYAIPLKCQYCGKEQNVVIDLAETEYVCEQEKGGCGRKNAIYINFMTAAIADVK
jgi:hypothetical protein